MQIIGTVALAGPGGSGCDPAASGRGQPRALQLHQGLPRRPADDVQGRERVVLLKQLPVVGRRGGSNPASAELTAPREVNKSI